MALVSLLLSRSSSVTTSNVKSILVGHSLGNHVHHALQRQATHSITHCHVNVVSKRCPELLFDALLVADRYTKLMTLYADCTDIFSRKDAVTSKTIDDLEKNLTVHDNGSS